MLLVVDGVRIALACENDVTIMRGHSVTVEGACVTVLRNNDGTNFLTVADGGVCPEEGKGDSGDTLSFTRKARTRAPSTRTFGRDVLCSDSLAPLEVSADLFSDSDDDDSRIRIRKKPKTAAWPQGTFRTLRKMWMVEHGDGSATWLYSPKETGPVLAEQCDEQHEVWAFSDFKVSDVDYKEAKQTEDAPPLCTHYVEANSTGGVLSIIRLPWDYREYVLRPTTYFSEKLEDVYRNALNRGNQQKSFAQLRFMVENHTPLVEDSDLKSKREECTVCSVAGRPARFRFGSFNAGVVCAEHIRNAITAHKTVFDLTRSLADPSTFETIVSALQNATQQV